MLTDGTVKLTSKRICKCEPLSFNDEIEVVIPHLAPKHKVTYNTADEKNSLSTLVCHAQRCLDCNREWEVPYGNLILRSITTHGPRS
jgi:hypothetical protein